MANLHTRNTACLALAYLCLVPTVQAAGTVTTTIASVRADTDGKGIIEFAQPVGGTPPGCVASGFGSMMSFNANNVGGKAVLAVALAAKAAGTQVFAAGAGTCTHYSNTIEDISYLLQR